MSDYNYFQKSRAPKEKKIHPVWSGIGCLMAILTPIISWAASLVLLDYGKSQNWSFLNGFSSPIRFPDIMYQIPLISIVTNYISSISFFEVLVMFFIIFMLLFSGIFTFINAILYRLFGPPRFSAIDAPPPPRRNAKRYKR
jgi:hypothetical protein